MRWVFASLLLAAGIGAAAFVLAPTFLDQWRAAQFSPPQDIQTITKKLSFTDRGKQIFYATAPEINDSAEFNDHCKSTERTSAILGCYYRDRIYVYHIQNEELSGALEVTAAHEMLHAAYARLNIFERKRVDALVEQEYETIKDDVAIKQIMQYYHQAEPGDELNELHSIIGTTFGDLPSELEQYYARYFTNRAQIVALNQQYTSVFTRLNTESEALQQQLKTEAPTIKAEIDRYMADLTQLNQDIQTFNQRAQDGSFANQSDFQTARSALIARSNEMTTRQTTLNSQIDRYNDDVTALNKLAVRADQLNKSINGVSAPGGVE